MPETRVRIPVEQGRISLEGRWEEGRGGRNALLCHPHPLYGGSMDNNVVSAARTAFARSGWATLRFNFRGVGASGGTPGEGDRDAEDVLALTDYLRARYPGPVDLAAYSYGAWAAMKAIRLGLAPDTLLLFSPPLDFISFAGLELPDVPTFITLGNQDEFCSIDSLRHWLAGQPHADRAEVAVFAYGDHFYSGLEPELTAKVENFLGRAGLLPGD